MKIKTLQWNIGGGKIRKQGSDAKNCDSYSVDGITYISEIIQQYNPDIVTLQEVHVGTINQAKEIAKKTGMPFYIVDSYDDSHLEKNQKLSQAIISRFPLTKRDFTFFYNPEFEITHNNITYEKTHDKGLTTAIANLGNLEIEIKTLHMIPWRKCNVNPLGDEAKEAREDINKKLAPTKNHFLIQGDFNIDDYSVKEFLPKVMSKDRQEIINEKPTTPKGRRYDHIVYKGMQLVSFSVLDNALTDHYPLLSEFEIIF